MFLNLRVDVLVLLGEDDPDYHSARVNLWRYGIKLTDDSTWRQWRRFRSVELGQAVAPQLFLDPDTVPWHSIGVRAHHRTSIGQLFGDRMRLALRHVEHESLPILAAGEHSRRAKVTPWEFAEWCDDIGQPCSARPRTKLSPGCSGTTRPDCTRRWPTSALCGSSKTGLRLRPCKSIRDSAMGYGFQGQGQS